MHHHQDDEDPRASQLKVLSLVRWIKYITKYSEYFEVVFSLCVYVVNESNRIPVKLLYVVEGIKKTIPGTNACCTKFLVTSKISQF